MNRQEASEFYRIHSKPLYNTAKRILRDSEEAEEVMQDTLLKYITGGVISDSPAQASAWLRTTCVHMAIDRLRRRRREPSTVDLFSLDSRDKVLPLEEEPVWDGPVLDIGLIRDVMEKLPDPYRLVLNLILIEGMDYSEIARLTSQKETTLRSIYSRGRAKLAQKLREMIAGISGEK